jgi:hypothetical protein
LKPYGLRIVLQLRSGVFESDNATLMNLEKCRVVGNLVGLVLSRDMCEFFGLGWLDCVAFF